MQKCIAKPNADWLIGNREISRYIGICERSVANWREKHALPVAKLPDGRVGTSKGLLDTWLMARINQRLTLDSRTIDNPPVDKSE